jgi:hypothetical protein
MYLQIKTMQILKAQERLTSVLSGKSNDTTELRSLITQIADQQLGFSQEKITDWMQKIQSSRTTYKILTPDGDYQDPETVRCQDKQYVVLQVLQAFGNLSGLCLCRYSKLKPGEGNNELHLVCMLLWWLERLDEHLNLD